MDPVEAGAAGAAGAAARLRQCGLRACLLLTLGAWRARRAEAKTLRGRLDQVKLQVATLRALNNAEAERAALAHQEAGAARAASDSLRRQLHTLRVEHDAVLETRAELEVRLCEQHTAAENLRNQLQSAEQEAAALEQQLSKERNKLVQGREERAQLSEEMQVLEQDLEEKAQRIKEMERLLEETQSRHDRALEETQAELVQFAARCKALEQAVQSEQLSNAAARQALAENVLELCRVRAQLEAELSPRRTVSRVLALLSVPLQVIHSLYVSISPIQSSSTRIL